MKQEINVKKDIYEIRNENLRRKEYLLYIYENGEGLDFGERSILPRRYYKVCSLEDISKEIALMKELHWRHPLLKNGMRKNEVNAIPFEEKEWGLNYRIEIFPISEELEQYYLEASKEGFFKMQRSLAKKKIAQ
jgi:hypothetical protein